MPDLSKVRSIQISALDATRISIGYGTWDLQAVSDAVMNGEILVWFFDPESMRIELTTMDKKIALSTVQLAVAHMAAVDAEMDSAVLGGDSEICDKTVGHVRSFLYGTEEAD